MSNVAGKAYGMNVVTPMRPCLTWINRAVFMASRAIPSSLGGLLGLSIIHFARWVIIKRDQWPDLGQGKQALQNDYMLFCSNFNGTWDQYIDAFSDGIPSGLDLLWISSTKYPHSIPISPFKNYIRANQIDTDYYYNSVPGAAQRDIKSALRVRRAILDLAAQQASLSPADFRKLYVATLVGVQNDLGYQGYAPVASIDTDNADQQPRGLRSNVSTRPPKRSCEPADRPTEESTDADIRWGTLFSDGPRPDPDRRDEGRRHRDIAGSCLAQASQLDADRRANARLRRRAEPVRAQHAQPFRALRDHRRRGLQRTRWAQYAFGDARAGEVNLTVAQPQDHLTCPFLLFAADFDAKSGADEERDSYLVELWNTMGAGSARDIQILPRLRFAR